MHAPAVEIIHCTKIFPPPGKLLSRIFKGHQKNDDIVALDDVCLKAQRGEFLVIAGPNGAGKTTLLKILAGLIVPTSGTAKIHGMDVVKQQMQAKRLTGLLVCDERSFYWRLSGRENLLFFGRLYGLSAASIEQRLEGMRPWLDIDALDIQFQRYSSGNKQKVALARSLIANPQVLIMDEPTRNLDVASAQGLVRLIKDVVTDRGVTAFFCTHNPREVLPYSDKFMIMDKGRIMISGNPQDYNYGI